MKIMHLLPHKEKRTENTQSNVLVCQLPESRSSKTPSPRPVTARPAKGRCSALNSFYGARCQTSLSSSFVSSTGIANTGAGITDVADGRAAVLRWTGHARAHHFNLPLAGPWPISSKRYALDVTFATFGAGTAPAGELPAGPQLACRPSDVHFQKATPMAFTFICHASAVSEGSMGFFQAGRKSVLLVWPTGGELKAYRGRCPHGDMPLNDAIFKEQTITCPHHQWGFDCVSGKCVTHLVRNALHPYALRVEGDEIQVDVGPVKAAHSPA
jgi:toluene monooxygenase system ferredoxin subunit